MSAIERYIPGRFAENLPGELTPTSLVLHDDVKEDSWASIGAVLGRMARSNQWWIGDWIAHGERKYGETYAQAVNDTGLDEQTLMNYVWVSNSVHPDVRREDLSWSHHLLVAKLTKAQQKRWLEHAAAGGWSVSDLRGELRKSESSNGGHREGASLTFVAKALKKIDGGQSDLAKAMLEGEADAETVEIALQKIEDALRPFRDEDEIEGEVVEEEVSA